LPLADRYGRKTIYVIIGIFMFFATTLISLSPNYYVYAVMKFISGATTGVTPGDLSFIVNRPTLWKTFNIITNRTTALGMYSVLIPKDIAGSLMILQEPYFVCHLLIVMEGRLSM
jgi:MFS family permease